MPISHTTKVGTAEIPNDEIEPEDRVLFNAPMNRNLAKDLLKYDKQVVTINNMLSIKNPDKRLRVTIAEVIDGITGMEVSVPFTDIEKSLIIYRDKCLQVLEEQNWEVLDG
jgi:hypothetical protein